MEVFSFSEDSFATALSNQHTTEDVIKNKRHFQYFNSYLGNQGLAVKTFVVENEYVSKDFLHDYASYYAFCFEKYPKFCKRIHFFSSEFSQEQLEIALLSPDGSFIWESYLGFIVVKPIPVTIVGYTVLKVYNNGDEPALRKFWGLRDYKVHFFGRVLSISSLAFQEQDSVLAACATTAIWSMLNKASLDFHTILKVPSEITKDADNLSNDGSRLFPNKGLTILQICQAINNSGLAPEVRLGSEPVLLDEGWESFIPNIYLKKILNAYELIGIPIILGVKVPTSSGYGYHAIAVSGHKVYSSNNPSNTQSVWVANRIEKIYVHDDQFGPFAKVDFIDELTIESPWTSVHEARLPTYVVNIIIPVYPKIRISYEDIEVIVVALNGILLRAFDNEISDDLYWDIKISYSEAFKQNVINSNLDSSEKLQLIEKSLPKYIWTATCYFGATKLIDFTFDATDVSNGMLGEDIVCYFDAEIKAYLHQYIEQYRGELMALFEVGGQNYLDFMLAKIS